MQDRLLPYKSSLKELLCLIIYAFFLSLNSDLLDCELLDPCCFQTLRDHAVFEHHPVAGKPTWIWFVNHFWSY